MRLTIKTKGPKGPRKVELEVHRPVVRVGRHSENDLVVKDPKVSRKHFRLDCPALGCAKLVHLASDNWTMVDGVRVVGEHALRDGSVIRVGDTELVVHLDAEATIVSAPPLKTRAHAKSDFAETHGDSDEDTGPLSPCPEAPPSLGDARASAPAARPRPAPPACPTDNAPRTPPATVLVPAPVLPPEAPAPSPAPRAKLRRLGPYAFDRPLHEASYGAVAGLISVAHDEAGAQVVLKVLRGARAGSRQSKQFVRAAGLWASVSHPNVVALLHDGSTETPPFVAIEYCPLGSLADALRRGPLIPEESLRAFTHVAQALEVLGRRRIVHRGVHPSNVLLGDDGQYKLSDFMLAKSVDAKSDDGGLTETGHLKGVSLDYIAPEQLVGLGVDERADLYALGVFLYELLAGRSPYAELVKAYAERPAQLTKGLLAAPAPPLPDLSTLPSGVDRVLLRCVEVREERRYTSAAELLADLDATGWAR